MSSMIFIFDERSPLWYYSPKVKNKDIFLCITKQLKELYHQRIKARDVLDLNDILRAFGIIPEPIHQGLFVLGNRYSKEEPDFINILVCHKDKIIFEVTDLRRD